jgi:predicted RNase H-related nuclease YkuK (DUF458 family)
MSRKDYKIIKKYGKDFFKNLKEESVKKYEGIPALNWGETINGKHTYPDRYYFNWSTQDINGNLRKLNLDVEKYILDVRERNKDKKMKVFLGVDSQNELLKTKYVAVIVLRFHKNGAHEIVSTINLDKIYDTRYKLLREADIMAQLVRNYKEFFKENNLEYECHMDYNRVTNFKSNGVVQEAMSYFKTQEIEVKIKPDAWAASYAADHFC